MPALYVQSAGISSTRKMPGNPYDKAAKVSQLCEACNIQYANFLQETSMALFWQRL